MSACWALLARDVRLALRLGGGGGIAVAFFALTVVLVPLGIGGDLETLRRISGGIVWIAALLAALLSLDRLFQADFEDGSLDQLMLTPMLLEQVVLTKAAAHWLTTGVPMTIAVPLLGAALGLDSYALLTLALAVAAGAPALSLIGAIAAAVVVGVRRGGLLLSILVLPLWLPTLIFGSRAVENSLLGLSPWPLLSLLGALTLFSAALAPFAAAAALRINMR